MHDGVIQEINKSSKLPWNRADKFTKAIKEKRAPIFFGPVSCVQYGQCVNCFGSGFICGKFDDDPCPSKSEVSFAVPFQDSLLHVFNRLEYQPRKAHTATVLATIPDV